MEGEVTHWPEVKSILEVKLLLPGVDGLPPETFDKYVFCHYRIVKFQTSWHGQKTGRLFLEYSLRISFQMDDVISLWSAIPNSY